MAPLREFTVFPKLPAELRQIIWEFAILEHNHNRLVPVNQHTKRILCFRHLACSPHFRANFESRSVAKRLYPLRLRVTGVTGSRRDFHVRTLEDLEFDYEYGREDPNDRVESTYSLNRRMTYIHGAIYISTEHDIFTFSIDRYGPGESEKMSLSLRQNVRRLMKIDLLSSSWSDSYCRIAFPTCIRECATIFLPRSVNNVNFEVKVFPRVQKVLFTVLDKAKLVASQIHGYSELLERLRGHELMEMIDNEHWMARFNAVDLKKHDEFGHWFCTQSTPGTLCERIFSQEYQARARLME
ncbi:hypothetical protein F4808DRAFT_476357 [Astrocystis sublimbata]|nr:hypothetical protein F4808DRAFT_476357 [Astrocystis sublimbata]